MSKKFLILAEPDNPIVKRDEEGIAYLSKEVSFVNLDFNKVLNLFSKIKKIQLGPEPNAVFISGNDIKAEFYKEICSDSFFITPDDISEADNRKMDLAEKTTRSILMSSNIIFAVILNINDARLTISDASQFAKFQSNAKEFLIALFEAGLDPSIKSIDGITPLHLAARLGLTEIVDLLIKRGANIHAKTFIEAATPMHYVSYSRDDQKVNCSKLLLDAGASIIVKTKSGHTALSSITSSNADAGKEIFEHIKLQTAKFGYKHVYEILLREPVLIKADEVNCTIIREIARFELRNKVKVKFSVQDLNKVVERYILAGACKVSPEVVDSMATIHDIAQKIPFYTAAVNFFNIKIAKLSALREAQKNILQNIEKIFHLVAKLNNHGADKSAIKLSILESQKILETKYSFIESFKEDDDIIFEPGALIKGRIAHLNTRLKANGIKPILPEIFEAAETGGAATAKPAFSSEELEEDAEFDGKICTENLRKFAKKFSNDETSEFSTSVLRSIEYSSSSEAEELEFQVQLSRILSSIKSDKSEAAKTLRYAKNFLPASILLKFLASSNEASFHEFLEYAQPKAHIDLFRETVSAAGGFIEPEAPREWQGASEKELSILRKIREGRYIEVSKSELSDLLIFLGYTVRGFAGECLNFYAIAPSGDKIGGHFIHRKDVGVRGSEIDYKPLCKLREICSLDGTFKHYGLETEVSAAAGGAGGAAASGAGAAGVAWATAAGAGAAAAGGGASATAGGAVSVGADGVVAGVGHYYMGERLDESDSDSETHHLTGDSD